MNRRTFVQLGAAGGMALLGGCGPIRELFGRRHAWRDLPASNSGPVRRLLDRAGYGPVPGDPARVAQIGHEAYVEEQLRADLPEDPTVSLQIARMDVFTLSAAEMGDISFKSAQAQLQQAALLRAVYSPNQLYERMVAFWSDHFNIYAPKAYGSYRIPTDYVEVIRKHALGKFPDMVLASAKSPAMLEYLDNHLNRKGTANENYARELMELHTLGVHGGYTQRDVQEVARCFTGWTIENRFGRSRGRFLFDESRHDDGEKFVLGVRIAPGLGVRAGERVIEIITSHPSTASHIARKLCGHFVGAGFPDLERRVAAVYLQTKGDIRSMLREILNSKELLESPPLPKRPFDFVVSALRAVDAGTDAGAPVLDHLDKMGHLPNMWPMPDGYPTDAHAWTGTLLARWNFAYALASGRIEGTKPRLGEGVKNLSEARRIACEAVLGVPSKAVGSAPKAVRDAPSFQSALFAALASPEFQWR